MIDWAWMADHLDELAARTLQHIEFTVIALLFGFVISFALAVIAVRRRSSYGPIVAVADILYVIPSLAFFSGLIAITGLTIVTVEIPLILYTLLIFVRNIAEGFDSVPADVLESADGMGYTRMGRLRRVEIPLAIPLMVAGLRLACVSTIGLVTVSAVLSDASAGWAFSSSRATTGAFRPRSTSARSPRSRLPCPRTCSSCARSAASRRGRAPSAGRMA